jgi:hypothetical protein
LVPIATVMLDVKVVATFAAASSAVTCTAGIAAPAELEIGGVVKASWVALPGVMLNGRLVDPSSAPYDAISV